MELGYGCEPVLTVAQSGATRCPKDQARPLVPRKDAQPIPMLHPDFKVLLDLTSFLSVPTPLLNSLSSPSLTEPTLITVPGPLQCVLARSRYRGLGWRQPVLAWRLTPAASCNETAGIPSLDLP